MKLGIVVVYMVSEHQTPLLELHLQRIERHTSIPYAIYGSANRLLPQLRERLGQRSRVRIFDLEPTELRGAQEHSWYLEQLVDRALADGATHVATLHVDSFPVADGWAEFLVDRAGSTFATLDGVSTACLLFPRAFRESFRPRFHLPEEERKGLAFEQFMKECVPTLHSGVDYAFAAYKAGLKWHSMKPTARTRALGGSAVFDGILFHLEGAFRLSPRSREANTGLVRRVGDRRFSRLVRAIRDLIPSPVRRSVRALLGKQLERAIDAPRERFKAAAMELELSELLADSDVYFEELRRSRAVDRACDR